ncbi:MAG: tRNA pseudouridine(55) synthase TruB [Flavobacteriaceae bacterium]|nr:tRNA pseudouridine(55) synthase TruB [Flavobacteriaceae bacterium]
MNAEDFLNGQILLIDKPLGWSSFQAVNKIRWVLKKRFQLKKIKVGHAGTLDPLATGLLVICTGKFTKRIPELQGQIKTYTGTIGLHATTPSYDLETEIDQTFDTSALSETAVRENCNHFLGEIKQYPPVFSALKKDGKRLYEYARQGKEVTINPRLVQIDHFELSKVDLPFIDFEVVCSKGTYIRSLAYDFGKKLGVGGHLTALRRTKIGEFDVDNAVSPSAFEEYNLGSAKE